MVANYKATGSLKYNVEIGSAKAITQINDVKRAVRDMTKDIDYQSVQLKSLGRYEEAHQRTLSNSKQAYEQLDFAVKDMTRQVEKENALSNKTTEQQNKIMHQLNDLKNLRGKYANQIGLENKKLILYNDDLRHSNNLYTISVKYGNERVRTLQAEGREQDVLKQKTQSYGEQVGLLEDKLKAQEQARKKYVSSIKETFNGSDAQFSKRLTNDYDLQKLENSINKTRTALAGANKGWKDNNLQTSLYSKELKTLNTHLEQNKQLNNNEVKSLQAKGRTQDALREKTKGYIKELDLLQNKEVAQQIQLQSYKDAYKKTNGSLDGFSSNSKTLELNKGLSDTTVKMAEISQSYIQAERTASLYNKELADLDKQLTTSKQVSNSRVSQLRAEGKEQEALKEKTKGYAEQLDLLDKKKQAQNIKENNYNEAFKATELGSPKEIDSKLLNDNVYLKHKRESASIEDSYAKIQNHVKESGLEAAVFNEHVNQANKDIAENAKITNEQIRMLQAVGREEDAIQRKAKSYEEELNLLEQKRKSQQSALANMSKQYYKDYDGSRSDAESAINDNEHYRNARLSLEKTNADIANRKALIDKYSTGLVQARMKSIAFNKETSSLGKMIEAQTGSYTAAREVGSRLTQQRELDINAINAQVQHLKLLRKTTDTSTSAYKREVVQLNQLAHAFATAGKKEKEYNGVMSVSRGLSKKQANFLDKNDNKINEWGKSAQTGSSLASSTLPVTIGLGGGLMYGARNAAQLENSYNKSKVLMETGGENDTKAQNNIDALRNDITKASIKYGINQHQMSKSVEELTRRGYSSDQVRGTQDQFMKASIASGDEYGDVVHNGGSVIESFNPKRRHLSKSTRRILNEMTYASDLTATDFKNLGYGAAYASTTAHQAGLTSADTMAALGSLSNQGISGSASGTSLRRIINRLVNPGVKSSAPMLQKLGLLDAVTNKKGKVVGYNNNQLLDSNGNMLPINEAFEKINDAMKNQGLTKAADKNFVFNSMFGATGQAAAMALSQTTGNKRGELGYLSRETATAADKYNGRGYNDEISNRNMKTAEQQIKRLKEAGRTLSVSFATSVLPIVSKVAEKVADISTHITKAPPVVKDIFGITALAIPGITAIGLGVAGVSKGMMSIRKLVGGIVKAWAVMKNGFSGNGFKFEKQETELEKQLKQVQILTEAINNNTKAKETNSSVDMNDTVTGSSSKKSAKYEYANGIGNIKNDEFKYANKGNYGIGSNEYTRVRNANSNIGSYSSTTARTSGYYTSDGKRSASNGLKGIVSKNKFLSSAKNITKNIDGMAVALGGLDIATSALTSNANNRGKNIGGAAGSAIGGGIGMLVPVPGLDILVSTMLTKFGGAGGEKLGKFLDTSINNQQKDIKKQEHKDGSDSKSHRNSPGRTNASYDSAEYAASKQTETKQAKDAEKSLQKKYKGMHWDIKKQKMVSNTPVKPTELKENEARQVEMYDKLDGDKHSTNNSSKLLRDFVKDSNNATRSWASSTNKNAGSVIKAYDKMFYDIKANNDKRLNSDKKTYDYLIKQGLITKNEAKKNLADEKSSSDNRIKVIKNNIDQLAKIDAKGGKGREAAIRKLNQQVLSLTNAGAKAQKNILKQLNHDTGKLSKEHYIKTILDSNKAKDKTIANATATYKATVKGADKQLSTEKKKIKGISSLSEKQKNALISKAKKQHDKVVESAKEQQSESVHWAKEQHSKVVNEAREQAEGVTGAVKSAGSSISNILDSITQVQGLKNTGIFSVKNAKTSKNYKPKLENSVSNNVKLIDSLNNGSFGKIDKNKKIKLPAYALGGKIAKEETALVNEDGEESVYNRHKGYFKIIKGKAGLVKLHDGEEILNHKQTSKLLKNHPVIDKKIGAYSKGKRTGSTGTVTVKLDTKGVSATIKQVRKTMSSLNKILSKEYKRATKQSSKELSKFKKFSHSSWSAIGKETSKQTKSMTNLTHKQFSEMSKQTGKSTRDIASITDKNYKNTKSTVSKATSEMLSTNTKNTKNLVNNYHNIISKLPGYASDAMKMSVANLNKGYNGINDSLKQFGGNVQVLNPIHYAIGSSGKLPIDQLAMVNDATSGPKQEAIVRDNKVLLPTGNDRVLNLKHGDQVLNGRQTEKLLKSETTNNKTIYKYANGSGVNEDALRKVSKDNSKNPNKFFNDSFKSKVKIDGSNLRKAITNTILKGIEQPGKAWSSAIWNLIQNTIKGNEGGSGSKGAFLKYAEKIGMGKAYNLGSSGPNEYDCSGLVSQALNKFGINIGRSTVAMQNSSGVKRLGKNINNSEVGDLVLFGHSNGISGHVGIVANKSKGLMMNATKPHGMISRIADVTSVPLDAYYSVKGLSSDDKKNNSKGDKGLNALVKRQLGKKALKWIEDHLSDEAGGSLGNPGGESIQRWNLAIKRALRANHLEATPFRVNAIERLISRESGGNPTAINKDDINWQRGDPSKGLMQVIGSNFKRFHFKGHDNTFNGFDNILAGINLIKHNYGTSDAAFNRVAASAYANGGLSKKHKLAEVSENNKPEMLIPLTNKSRSVELIIKSLEYMFGNSSYSKKAQSNGNSTSNRIINELVKSNKEKDKKINNVLRKMDKLINVIQNKPVLSEFDIYKANQSQNKKYQRIDNFKRGAF